MTRTLLPFAALLFVACPGAGLDKESASGLDSALDAACEIEPAACDEDGDGFRPSTGDCDDVDANVHPDAEEICDGNDNNCDGDIDEGVTTTYYTDVDVDGFGDPATGTDACEPPTGTVSNDDDCDDQAATTFPGGTEVCDNVDNNCDGSIDEGVTNTYYADADGDNYGDAGRSTTSCEQPDDYVVDNTDCDDSSEVSFPGNPEVCDTLDNDCNGAVDEGVTYVYYADMDGDTYGDLSSPIDACSLPRGYSESYDDCDDAEAAVNPGATEVCNGIDDDCEGTVDEGAADATVWYADSDSDRYGDATTSVTSCDAPRGYVADDTDCDDNRDETNPGASEYCNGIDDDCDTEIDEGSSLDAGTWYADLDSDTYGDSANSTDSCEAPEGYVAVDGDCDDLDETSFPGGTEVCDGADNDCNGTIDDGATNGMTYYADADSDEFGDPATVAFACEQPTGYVENDYDCNDGEIGEPVVADALFGSGSGSGSASDPHLSLQAAIDQANECVLAMEGTYEETIDLGGKNLDVFGVGGSEVTTIDAGLSTCTSANPEECAAVVTIGSDTGAAPTLHGFTITGGTGATSSASSSQDCADSSPESGSNTCTVTTYNYCGGGVYVKGDNPTLEDVVITGNTLPVFSQVSTGDYAQTWTYSHGGGLCVESGSVVADYAWIHRNWADEGGGAYVGDTGSFSLDHGMLAENGASDGGGISIAGGTFTATNAVITCNDATTDGGGVFGESDASLTLTNVALYGNLSSTTGTSRGADVWMPAASTSTIVNSIIENSIASALLYGSGTGRLEYNNVYNADASGSTYGGAWSGGLGSISSGPNFVSADCDGTPTNDDWSLDASSASINAGNPSSTYNDTDGTANDAGPYGGPGGDW